jgi:hypothetical protein
LVAAPEVLAVKETTPPEAVAVTGIVVLALIALTIAVARDEVVLLWP